MAGVPSGHVEPQPLFVARLEAYSAIERPYVEAPDVHSGFSMHAHLIAQGEGRFEGPRLAGDMDFSILARKAPSEDVVETLVTGWLLTDDGVEVMFEATGPALSAGGPDWHYAGSFQMSEANGAYEWLNRLGAIWTGTLDVDEGVATFVAFSLDESRP